MARQKIPITTEALQTKLSNFSVSDRGCWEWAGAREKDGYGTLEWNGKKRKAHRLAYEYFIGPVDNLLVCHHCDNPPCINPQHLFLGTHKDNHLDSVIKGRRATGSRNGRNTHPERYPRGSNHPRTLHPEWWPSKLTPADVRYIRRHYKAGRNNKNSTYFARIYSVNRRTIMCAINGRHWRHI